VYLAGQSSSRMIGLSPIAQGRGAVFHRGTLAAQPPKADVMMEKRRRTRPASTHLNGRKAKFATHSLDSSLRRDLIVSNFLPEVIANRLRCLVLRGWIRG